MVSRETVEPCSRSHCRFFAPHYGLPEDIVTGSVHSALAVWLLDAGLFETADVASPLPLSRATGWAARDASKWS